MLRESAAVLGVSQWKERDGVARYKVVQGKVTLRASKVET